jgi:hypothetical protein
MHDELAAARLSMSNCGTMGMKRWTSIDAFIIIFIIGVVTLTGEYDSGSNHMM